MSDSIHSAANPSHSSPPQPDGNLAEVSIDCADDSQAAMSGSADESTDWQTVTFPGAMDVDALPVTEATAAAFLVFEDEVDLGEPEADDREAVIGQLRQENADLRSQIFTLEQDLGQLQIELQLEMARFYCKESESPEMLAVKGDRDRLARDLDAAQGQIRQLSADLKLSQSTVETQQQELERLTQQLDQRQHRIAQLERDCALSQQRYNEQLQLVSQVEAACQDLRMRLHRQQQQTLQFKAALEKSIESGGLTLESVDEPPVESTPNPDHTAPLLLKARPVQPWSKPPGHAHSHKPRAFGLPELLAKLSPHGIDPETIAPEISNPASSAPELPALNEVAIAQELAAAEMPTTAQPPEPQLPVIAPDAASQNVLEFLFPQAEPPAAIAEVPVPQASVFDLSPFIEAGDVDPTNLPSSPEPTPSTADTPKPKAAKSKAKVVPMHPAAPDAPAPSAAPPQPATPPQGGLWADLARLIEPELMQQLEAAAQGVVVTEPTAPSPAPVPPAADPSPTPQTQPAVSAEPNPAFPSFTLRPTTAPQAVPAQPVVSQTEAMGSDRQGESAIAPDQGTETQASVESASFPSPTLYPSRPAKKLRSMAAVELPSFPRG